MNKTKIHLAIDAIGAKYGGSATGLIGILDAAINDERISNITVFCTPTENRVLMMPSSDKLIEVQKPWIDKNYFLRIFWYEWLLGFESRRIGADVLLVSANFGQGCGDVPHVTYVRQSLPFSKEAAASFKSISKIIKVRAYSWQMRRSCQNASRVITQSSVMKRSLIESFELEPNRVTPIYSEPKQLSSTGRAESLGAVNGEGAHPWHMLYVGNDVPYKKLDTIVQGLEKIQRRFKATRLTMTLPPSHHYASRTGVKCVGYLQDPRLAQAYRSAHILVLPSLVESGPQSPIEAMSLGTPVLIADRPYAHDVCEDAALFFDPNSPEDFAEKAIRLLTDKALRQTLIARGFKLIEKRRDAQPYQKIIDICVDVALEARRTRS